RAGRLDVGGLEVLQVDLAGVAGHHGAGPGACGGDPPGSALRGDLPGDVGQPDLARVGGRVHAGGDPGDVHVPGHGVHGDFGSFRDRHLAVDGAPTQHGEN